MWKLLCRFCKPYKRVLVSDVKINKEMTDLKKKEAETVKPWCIWRRFTHITMEEHKEMAYGSFRNCWNCIILVLPLLMNTMWLQGPQSAFAMKYYRSHHHIRLPGDILALMAAQEASLKAQKAVWAPPLSPRTTTMQVCYFIHPMF